MTSLTGAVALGDNEFAALMAPLGPFESNPHVAAGVSGGSDSMALAVLLHRWARTRDGQFTALIVDHGLRPESAAEARRAGRRLRALGIAHRLLRWSDPVLGANLLARARQARHDLLAGWCARHGVLHLALAHHLEDQAETFLLRLGRGSGLDGLAAMATVGARDQVRLLRPMLSVPRARLTAGLKAAGIEWIEDPTNRDPHYARVRLRGLAPDLAAEGLGAARLAATAAHLGRAREALNESLADLLVRAVRLHPAGYARLDAASMAAAPDELALRALARLLTCLGGLSYAPRLDRLERLLARLRAGLTGGATLGGCRILPTASQTNELLVVRELRATPVTVLRAGPSLLWDNRFEIAVRGSGRFNSGRSLSVAALGRAGWAALRPQLPDPESLSIPGPVRPSLPAISDRSGLLAVPHLGYRRLAKRSKEQALFVSKCRFAPKNGLTAGSFTVA